MFVPDEKLGWVMLPNAQFRQRLYGGHEALVRTNSLGFRDREHSVDGEGARFRVVVLGDSFVWGFGVNNEDIFTVRLREMLPGVQLINLGVTGYNLTQEHELLKLRGLTYDPDLVVVTFCQNDITSVRIPTARKRNSESGEITNIIRRLRQQLSQRVFLYDLFRIGVNRNKRLARFLVRVGVKESLGGYDELDVNLRPALVRYPDVLERDWTSATAELGRIQETCQAHSVKIVVAAIPARQAIDADAMLSSLSYVDYDPSDFAWEKPYRMLAEYCKRRGLHFVNAYPAFRESEAGLYLQYDMHFSPEGHRLFADLLAPAIKKVLIEDRVAAAR